jgi:hypothetical protein
VLGPVLVLVLGPALVLVLVLVLDKIIRATKCS